MPRSTHLSKPRAPVRGNGPVVAACHAGKVRHQSLHKSAAPEGEQPKRTQLQREQVCNSDAKIKRKVHQDVSTMPILIQMLWLQEPLDVLVTVKGRHPKQDPARHVLEVYGTEGKLRAPGKEVISKVNVATLPEVEICDDLQDSALTAYNSSSCIQIEHATRYAMPQCNIHQYSLCAKSLTQEIEMHCTKKRKSHNERRTTPVLRHGLLPSAHHRRDFVEPQTLGNM